MTRSLTPVFWSELALSIASAASLALTALWPQWIELLFGFDPDGGNGSDEWGITLSLMAATATLIALTGREWRRARRNTAH